MWPYTDDAPPLLRTRRLTLHRLCMADQDAFLAATTASRALHRPWVKPPTEAKAFHALVVRSQPPQHHAFVLRRRTVRQRQAAAGDVPSGALVGSIHLTHVVMGSLCSGYLGYFAFEGHQGQGLMTEGLKAVLRHALGPLGLHRVEANIQPGNTASIALVQRCGFAREGFSPRYLKINGRWRDHERWAFVKPG